MLKRLKWHMLIFEVLDKTTLFPHVKCLVTAPSVGRDLRDWHPRCLGGNIFWRKLAHFGKRCREATRLIQTARISRETWLWLQCRRPLRTATRCDTLERLSAFNLYARNTDVQGTRIVVSRPSHWRIFQFSESAFNILRLWWLMFVVSREWGGSLPMIIIFALYLLAYLLPPII